MFNIIEKFLSIDGEGPTSGQLATFIRFHNCNLRCSWCDTTYSFSKENIVEQCDAEALYQYILQNKAKNVTLTGGEPLLQEDLQELLFLLCNEKHILVHIETNGSIPIASWKQAFPSVSFIVDFKLPASGMNHKMDLQNLTVVDKKDVYKFVITDYNDLEYAYRIISEYKLSDRTNVYFSPVSGRIEPVEIVEFMKHKKLIDITLQLQLHKIIWSPDQKGV